MFLSFSVLDDFFHFYLFFWFLCILGPPYCGISATIRIGREIRCLPYAGFLHSVFFWFWSLRSSLLCILGYFAGRGFWLWLLSLVTVTGVSCMQYFYQSLLPERQSHGLCAFCFFKTHLNSQRLGKNKHSCISLTG